MPPQNPPSTLFCSVNDLSDYLSQEGVNLRLCDNASATGQYVAATATALLDATTVAVQPLTAPLPAGATLDFGGSDMAQIIQAVTAAPAPMGATSLTVFALPAQVNGGAVAIDGGVNAVELYRAVKATYYGTTEVRRYVQPRYPGMDSVLAQSWSVNQWAQVCAARWLCRRRGNGVPGSIEDDYQEAKSDLKAVLAGDMYIEDIGLGTAEWPAWSNTIVVPGYWLYKNRVQRPISEQAGGPPVGYSQAVEWGADSLWEGF